jgi:anti-sigma B factor antagonist
MGPDLARRSDPAGADVSGSRSSALVVASRLTPSWGTLVQLLTTARSYPAASCNRPVGEYRRLVGMTISPNRSSLLIDTINGRGHVMGTTGTQDSPLHVDQHNEGGAVVVRAAGEVDLGTAHTLIKYLTSAAEEVTPPAPVVADLREIQFFGSQGLAALVTAQQQCQQHHTALRLLVGPTVRRTLDITGMVDVLTICPTLTDALHPPDDPMNHVDVAVEGAERLSERGWCLGLVGGGEGTE